MNDYTALKRIREIFRHCYVKKQQARCWTVYNLLSGKGDSMNMCTPVFFYLINEKKKAKLNFLKMFTWEKEKTGYRGQTQKPDFSDIPVSQFWLWNLVDMLHSYKITLNQGKNPYKPKQNEEIEENYISNYCFTTQRRTLLSRFKTQ